MDSSPPSQSIKSLDCGGLLHSYLIRDRAQTKPGLLGYTALNSSERLLIVKERKDNHDISTPREEGYQVICQVVSLNHKSLSHPGSPTHLTLYPVWHLSYG